MLDLLLPLMLSLGQLCLPLIVANVVASFIPVRRYPPMVRRGLLVLDAMVIVCLVVIGLAPQRYNEWGLDDRGFAWMLGLFLFLSSLPVAKKCFYRSVR